MRVLSKSLRCGLKEGIEAPCPSFSPWMQDRLEAGFHTMEGGVALYAGEAVAQKEFSESLPLTLYTNFLDPGILIPA